jgi:hypothetical protein
VGARSWLWLLLALAWPAVASEPAPSWFAQDYRSPREWGFYCSGEGKSEELALTAARARCAEKICQLFGVEVESSTQTTETLEKVAVTSTTIEKCPKVRVVGRVEKKKVVSCEESRCTGYVYQLYPKKEYDLEYARLNQPPISQILERTIVVREGSETFRDPAACRKHLQDYSSVRGESGKAMQARVDALEAARKECPQLDYRNTELQEELRTYLITAMQARAVAALMALNRELMSTSKLEGKIEAFLGYEKRQLAAESLRPKLEKRLRDDFDWFFARDNYVSGENVWVMVNGKRVTKNPYLEELRTCERHFALARDWPGYFGAEIKVCVRGLSGGQDCQSLDAVTLRARLAGCLCQMASPGNPQECGRVLLQTLGETCPDRLDKDCYARAAAFTKERSGVLPPTPPG